MTEERRLRTNIDVSRYSELEDFTSNEQTRKLKMHVIYKKTNDKRAPLQRETWIINPLNDKIPSLKIEDFSPMSARVNPTVRLPNSKTTIENLLKKAMLERYVYAGKDKFGQTYYVSMYDYNADLVTRSIPRTYLENSLPLSARKYIDNKFNDFKNVDWRLFAYSEIIDDGKIQFKDLVDQFKSNKRITNGSRKTENKYKIKINPEKFPIKVNKRIQEILRQLDSLVKALSRESHIKNFVTDGESTSIQQRFNLYKKHKNIWIT